MHKISHIFETYYKTRKMSQNENATNNNSAKNQKQGTNNVFEGVKQENSSTTDPSQNSVQDPLILALLNELKDDKPSKKAKASMIATIAAAHLNADLNRQELSGKDVNYNEIVEESTTLVDLILLSVYGPETELN